VTFFPRSYRIILFLLIDLSGTYAQRSVRLNDDWEFLRQDLGGVWEAVRPVAQGDPGSVPVWSAVKLPHCVNARDAVDPDGNYYRGPAWYRTRLFINNPYTKGRTLLHFEGAGQKTDVYIYTTRVGSHTGGYDEWTIDITEAVAAFAATPVCQQQFKGRIPLSIRTDNSRDLEMIPSSLSDFNIYGGLYRYLNLVYMPPLSVDKVFTNAMLDPKGKEGSLHVTALLYQPTDVQPVSFLVRLTDPDGHLIREQQVSADRSRLPATARSRLAATARSGPADGAAGADTVSLGYLSVHSPKAWSPDHPVLYSLSVTVTGTDGIPATQTIAFGFRNFSFADHGPFFLNGRRMLLQGTHRHEDHAGLGAAMTEDLMRTEMILMKEMGVNFIRLAHYQQSRIILDLCDSLGIMVWEEIPWCRGGLGGGLYKEQARRMLTNMIGQHYDHPAVIIWGLGNENDWPGDFPEFEKEKIRGFMKELNQLAHHLDPFRLTAIRRCDFCSDIPDVYSPSIWAGWYRGIYTEYRSSAEEEFKKVPHFFHAEWGGDSHALRHSENPDKALLEIRKGEGADERTGDASLYGGATRVSKDGDWSETYICNLIDWHLKEQETMHWLTGSAQWVFKDFSTPLRPDNPIPFVNQKGVVERDMTKKESYYVFQSWWTSRPMVHIYGHSWPVRWGREGEEKMVKIYSNAENAELFLNGKSCGSRVRNGQDFPAAGLRWELVFQKGENKLRVIAHKGKTIVEDSVRFQYQTDKWGPPAAVQIAQANEPLGKPGDEQGVRTIRVRIVDDHGTLCPDAANWIRFGITGEGELIDDLGTSTGSRYVQAFNGQSMIRIRTRDGRSMISASVKGLPTVFLRVDPTNVIPLWRPAFFPDSIRPFLEPSILAEAAQALHQKPVTVTAFRSARSAGGPHDFFSEGDYWWPNPGSADSPYVQRDGETNPDNFTAHRSAMIRFSRLIGSLASAWLLTHDEKYVKAALLHVSAWFVDSSTLMNPNLLFAQAIKGRATGRSIGIIDTIQLMEVTEGLEAMAGSSAMDAALLAKIKDWFSRYLQWLTTHVYGKEEMNAANNHGTCWVMQVAAFARFTGNIQLMNFCRDRYKQVLLPGQMAADGSFPLEIKRTKPYGYSLFNLDALTTICQLLSSPQDNLWTYQTSDGRSVKKGIEFIYPFIADKNKWPFAHDVMFWREWPVAQPSLLFGANIFGNADWFHTWQRLDHSPANEEVIRNMPVRHPLIWMSDLGASAIDVPAVMSQIEQQTKVLLKNIRVATVSPDLFSPRTTENGQLKLVASRDWTSGFFPGECWMLYGYTQNEEWRNIAQQFTASLEKEKTNGTTHDMGFKIYSSFGKGYRFSKDEGYRRIIIEAARTLATRFNPRTGCIRSWDHHREKWAYPVIIDNMMNLELLFAATRLTGDSSFYKIAVSHANTTMKNHYRPDFSSFHVVDYDSLTGRVIKKTTWQGYSDSSAWSRGQAWGLYAFTMCYRFTKDPAYLRQAEHIAAFILHHPRLPSDKIPYWDFDAPGIPRTGSDRGTSSPSDAEPRDASAAAIIASGLYELCAYSEGRKEYRAVADTILRNLTDHYRAKTGDNKGFILLHSTGSKPSNSEVDGPLNYADYYYIEALLRLITQKADALFQP
jgi:beta-galactosidase